MVNNSRLKDEKWFPEKKSCESDVITKIKKIITSDYLSDHEISDEEEIEMYVNIEPPFDVKDFVDWLPYNFVFDIGFHITPLLSGYSGCDNYSNDCYCPCSKYIKNGDHNFPQIWMRIMCVRVKITNLMHC